MNEAFVAIEILCILFIPVLLAMVFCMYCACIRSSQISREEEKRGITR